MKTRTKGGYDIRWQEAINQVLLERGSRIRIDDIDDEFWETFLGPLVDSIEDSYA